MSVFIVGDELLQDGQNTEIGFFEFADVILFAFVKRAHA